MYHPSHIACSSRRRNNSAIFLKHFGLFFKNSATFFPIYGKAVCPKEYESYNLNLL